MVTSNKLPRPPLDSKAQLLTLALAALIAPASTAFCTCGTLQIGTDSIDGDALIVPMHHAGNQTNAAHLGGLPHLRQ